MNNNSIDDDIKTINLENVNTDPNVDQGEEEVQSNMGVGENNENSMTVEEENTENNSNVEEENTENNSNVEDDTVNNSNVKKPQLNRNIGGDVFPEQLSSRESDVFKNYERLVALFFRKPRSTDDFKRVTMNNMYVMIDKSNSNNKTVIIPPVIVNIQKHYVEQENRKNTIYNKISVLISNVGNETSNKKEFDELKEELKKINVVTNAIKVILSQQKDHLNQLNNDKTQGLFKLSGLYFKRTETYKNINREKVTNDKVTELLKAYNDNGRQLLSEQNMKKESEKHNMDITNVKKILEWINFSKEYIQLQAEVNALKKELEEKTELYDSINNNFILKMPEVKENKEVDIQVPEPKVKKGGDNSVSNHDNEVKLIKID
jgi:hypothetical protein